MDTSIIVIITVLGILCAVYAVFKPISDDRKARGGILNFDPGMKNLYYLPELSDEETLARFIGLEPKDMQWEFDADAMRLRVRRGETALSFRVVFFSREGRRYLRLERLGEEELHGTLAYSFNCLVIRELHAKAVDYRDAEAALELDGDENA